MRMPVPDEWALMHRAQRPSRVENECLPVAEMRGVTPIPETSPGLVLGLVWEGPRSIGQKRRTPERTAEKPRRTVGGRYSL